MKNELAVGAAWVRAEMKRGEPIFFVEVRHAGDWDLAVMKARGALRLDHDGAPRHVNEIPRERTVVVYSTAPDDGPAEAFARLLAGHGHKGVHFLAGGFKAYLSEGLPVEGIGEGRNMTRLRGY